MKFLRKFASGLIPGNTSSKLRRKRFQIFLNILEHNEISNPRIIDIGGSTIFWLQLNNYFNKSFAPVLVNKSKDWIAGTEYQAIVGDATDLSFIKDKSCDVVFSNSVIEHLENKLDQKKMFNEIKRIAKYYFIQTPAYIFPLEPHFLFPFFHWIPEEIRIWLVRHFNLGWYNLTTDYGEAKRLVESIRILNKKELKRFDKTASIIAERFLLIPKSYIITNLNS